MTRTPRSARSSRASSVKLTAAATIPTPGSGVNSSKALRTAGDRTTSPVKTRSVYEASALIVGGTRLRNLGGSNRRMPLPLLRLWIVSPGMMNVQDDRGPHNAAFHLRASVSEGDGYSLPRGSARAVKRDGFLEHRARQVQTLVMWAGRNRDA